MNITNTSKITVVLPGEATTRETFAAEELVKHLDTVYRGWYFRKLHTDRML